MNATFRKIGLTFLVVAITLALFLAGPFQVARAENPALPVGNSLELTKAEKDFIAAQGPIMTSFLRGVAPLTYVDKNGTPKGIAIKVLEEIAGITGLEFELVGCDTVDEMVSGPDIRIALASDKAYAANIPHIALTEPFLTARTELFLHKSVKADALDNAKLVLIKGATPPADVPAERLVFVNNREETFAAVNEGLADYGYGNEYSIAFYNLQNRYENLITFPVRQETREYCLGLLQNEPLLLSILNRALTAVPPDVIQAIVVRGMTEVELPITLSRLLQDYSGYVGGAGLLLLLLFGLWTYARYQSRNALELENQRYQVLADLSNEFLFEYDPRIHKLSFSQQVAGRFDEECIKLITKALQNRFFTPWLTEAEEQEIPLISCTAGIFRLVTGQIHDRNGKLTSVIGKVIDISKEAAEKEALLAQAQSDGLTGLFNFATTRGLVEKHLNSAARTPTDAFLMIDADGLKNINDTHGHAAGDSFLRELADVFNRTFRSTDIIGRHGGDEFAIYLKNISSLKLLETKCRQLIKATRIEIETSPVSICIGGTLTGEIRSYEELFKIADQALYEAKRKGPGNYCIAKTPSSFS